VVSVGTVGNPYGTLFWKIRIGRAPDLYEAHSEWCRVL